MSTNVNKNFNIPGISYLPKKEVFQKNGAGNYNMAQKPLEALGFIPTKELVSIYHNRAISSRGTIDRDVFANYLALSSKYNSFEDQESKNAYGKNFKEFLGQLKTKKELTGILPIENLFKENEDISDEQVVIIQTYLRRNVPRMKIENKNLRGHIKDITYRL